MPDQKGTVEQLLTHLANALAPLKDELRPELLEELGIGIPVAWEAQLEGAFASVASSAGGLPAAVQDLEAAVAAGGAVGIITKGVALGTRILEIAKSGKQLGDAITAAAAGDATLTPVQKASFTATAAKLFPRLTELMLVRAIEEKFPQLAAILDLTGIATTTPQPGVVGRRDGAAARPPRLRSQPRFEALSGSQGPGARALRLGRSGLRRARAADEGRAILPPLRDAGALDRTARTAADPRGHAPQHAGEHQRCTARNGDRAARAGDARGRRGRSSCRSRGHCR